MTVFGTLITGKSLNEKDEFLRRLDNAAQYSLDVLSAMPTENLSFQPDPEMRTFAELFQHLAEAQLYTAGQAIKVTQLKYPEKLDDKVALSEFVIQSYTEFRQAVSSLSPEDFGKQKPFWDGKATIGRILNFTLDHATHHRGQATVYLRLNNIRPPEYIGW